MVRGGFLQYKNYDKYSSNKLYFYHTISCKYFYCHFFCNLRAKKIERQNTHDCKHFCIVITFNTFITACFNNKYPVTIQDIKGMKLHPTKGLLISYCTSKPNLKLC